jgi:hypothetical protein
MSLFCFNFYFGNERMVDWMDASSVLNESPIHHLLNTRVVKSKTLLDMNEGESWRCCSGECEYFYGA